MFSRAELISCTKTDQDKYLLKYSLSWTGSWKNAVNCDGVYVFGKYLSDAKTGYRSMKFVQTSEGEFDYSDKLPQGCSVSGSNQPVGGYVPANGIGMFVFPLREQAKTDMMIREVCVEVRLDAEPKKIELFALEMVYVPEEKHFVGDPGNGISKGGTLKNCFYTYPDKGAYLITSENAIQFAPKEDCLYSDFDTPNGRQEDDTFVIPETFPKGYRSMWYMKYSLTEAQFVQFLNCLSRSQQQGHCMSDLSGEHIENYFAVTDTNEPKDRCEVVCQREGNTLGEPIRFYTAAPNRAMNAIAYADTTAFACFAGLRLMTELEYEKACRGPLPAIKEEFAWGSSRIGRVFHFDGADGSGMEKPIPQVPGSLCNCNYGTDIAPFEKEFKTVPDNPGWIGPVSVGLYENGEKLPGYTERECTGASYYGIMDLCGNVWENLVSAGRQEGRAYLPIAGNGELDDDGFHTMKEWPDSKTGVGIGVRGGVFVSPTPDYLCISLRVFAAHTKNDKRYHGGIRVGL